MNARHTAVIVLAAGLGTRMKSARPKVMQALGGRPMIGHVMDTVAALAPARTVVVIGPDMDDVAAEVAPAATAVQAQRRGTADAVTAARDQLADFVDGAGDDETILVVCGDSPLLSADTLDQMIAARADGATVVVLGFRPADPGDYGRLVVDETGALERIVEARDADAQERSIALCNSGVMAVAATKAFALIERIGNDNAKGEYYLTDIVAAARADGLACAVVEGDAAELIGINSRSDLAVAEAALQTRWRARALSGGATLVDPASVWFAHDTELGADVIVHPQVVFGPGVRVDGGAEIKSFSHIEGAHIGADAVVGPFARIRPETDIGAAAHVGNFVEIKNAALGAGAKANHLSYLGDATIGPQTNIGAGTITCNFDGIEKNPTTIGAEVFVGSNSVLVAPVTVGDGAFIAAGTAVTHNIEAGGLAIGRAQQVTKAGGASRLRTRLAARHAADQPSAATPDQTPDRAPAKRSAKAS